MNLKTNQVRYKEFGNPLYKEAANLGIMGIKEQQKGNFEEAKKQLQEGLDKLKILTINCKNDERTKAMSLHTLFQTFLKDCSTQEENEKIAMEKNFTKSLLMKDKQFFAESKDNFLSLLKQSKNINKNNPDEIFNMITKMVDIFSKANENGFFLTENIFIRSEIFRQGNAKIPYLHQKYDLLITINREIEGFLNLVNQDAINGNNIEGLINYLIDAQNWFSKEISIILPCKSIKNPNDKNEKNRTILFNKKFEEIKIDVENGDLNERLSTKRDYFRIFVRTCIHFKELKSILEPKHYKNDFVKSLNLKKKEICEIFYNLVIKLFLMDVSELTKRFIGKSILIFENNEINE